VRSRNARLAAIRSFLRFAVLKDPQSLGIIQRTLAIPMKRHGKPLVGFLAREEVQAVISAPGPSTWAGRRDQALLATLYNTGARVSEAINITVTDLALDGSPSIRHYGKGRKDRTVPIWPATALQLRRWLKRIDRAPDKPLFPTLSGCLFTRPAITDRVRRAVQAAVGMCASLARQRTSPHTFRHATAMHLLQSGVDITLVALWLGHESPVTKARSRKPGHHARRQSGASHPIAYADSSRGCELCAAPECQEPGGHIVGARTAPSP